MRLNYSMTPVNDAKAIKGMGRDFNISFKHAVVICDKVRGMKLSEAMNLLEAVIALEKTIPFKKFNKGIGHRRGLGKDNIAKYPKKAASVILSVLKNIEANADYKGLDNERLIISHIQALKGISRKRRKPKGRYATWRTDLINVQAVVEELE